MPEDMRPDQCGAIVILGQDLRHWKVIRAVPVGWTIPDHTLQKIKRYALSQKMALIYHEFEHENGVLTQTHRIGFGPPDFVAAFREAMEQADAKQTGADQTAPPGFG